MGTFNGFKHHQPVKDRIDYIFTSKENIEVEKIAVLSDSKDCNYLSDHIIGLCRVRNKKMTSFNNWKSFL